jgi:hypothetical protein
MQSNRIQLDFFLPDFRALTEAHRCTAARGAGPGPKPNPGSCVAERLLLICPWVCLQNCGPKGV